MIFYAKTIAAVRLAIPRHIVPEMPSVPEYARHEPHALAMCNVIEQMNTFSATNALKAARWIGYVYCIMESRGYWTNGRSRDLARQDVREGNTMPAWLAAVRWIFEHDIEEEKGVPGSS